MRRILLPVLLACAASACSNGDSSSTATATTSPSTVTEYFTGSVEVGGNDVHSFNVALSGGQVNVILTAAGPPATIYMGVGVGVFSSGSCSLLSNGYAVAPAGATAQLTGTVNAGSYCVMVFDAGNQSATVTYAVTVTHY